MDLHRQHGKQSNTKFVVKILHKYRSTNASHVKKKEEEHIRCSLSLCSFGDEDECYIGIGCSHHMTRGDKKCESLRKRKSGMVIIGNSAPTKVLRKFRTKIYKYRREVGTLLVQEIKHNILNVGEIMDKGNVNVFKSTKCKVIHK